MADHVPNLVGLSGRAARLGLLEFSAADAADEQARRILEAAAGRIHREAGGGATKHAVLQANRAAGTLLDTPPDPAIIYGLPLRLHVEERSPTTKESLQVGSLGYDASRLGASDSKSGAFFMSGPERRGL